MDVISAKEYRKLVDTLVSEEEICFRFVGYLKELMELRQIKQFTHVANENPSEKARKKNGRMGLSSGVPDYIIVTNRRKILFIEMKKKGGRVQESQNVWIKALSDNPGVAAKVC
jgi:hypothetical protein